MKNKRFTHINEEFICKNCGITVPIAKGSCRNHCISCLYSLHVDILPGDREAGCEALMYPSFIEVKTDKMVIHHKCLKCGMIKKNKAAPDDNYESLLKVARGEKI